MTSDAAASLLLVANPDPVHVGGHLIGAARALGLQVHLCDTRDAFAAPLWRRKMNWWFGGHRPTRLAAFGDRVLETARTRRVDCLLATGIAPLPADALHAIGRLGVKRLNFLTDDPWNPAHRAPWFVEALRNYDHIFTPRRANIADLASVGGPTVSYLPFAYAPEAHYPLPPTAVAASDFRADLVFVGGADRDRVEAVTPFIAAGFTVALYGPYWDRYRATRNHARGFLHGHDHRAAVAGAAVCLCLVRRANRDGHTMRSFEVAAMGGCMLVEETAEHHDIFGNDGEAVVYFRTAAEGVDRLRDLLANGPLRAALAERVRALVARGGHTYRDRLRCMVASGAQTVVA